MEYRFQRILLKFYATLSLAAAAIAGQLYASDLFDNGATASDIDTEFFDFGINTGFINIQDFTSEPVIGLNGTFRATEDFFMQVNYLQTDVSLSSFEKSQGQLFSGDDRAFKHFDFLVGYNLYQGEFFFSDTNAKLSSMYLVAGIGDTDFGGEESFTLTLGVGYQIALSRHYVLRFDYRNYIYDSSLLEEDNATQNTQLSAGLSYSF